MFNDCDREAFAILRDFLPGRIYDAHAHWADACVMQGQPAYRTVDTPRNAESYRRDFAPLFGGCADLRQNFFLLPSVNNGYFDRAEENRFVCAQLEAFPQNTAEITALPDDDEQTLLRQLTHPRIRGFKCYHTYLHRADSWNAGIEEYLPECAWSLADQKGLCITLHMVRDRALADEGNLRYIRTMAKKYPNAKLILAHAARAFAAWTGVETLAAVRDLDNVWIDFSAVCESPAMFQALHTVGVSRCMWGSDYPISMIAGKAISLADGFCWLYESELRKMRGGEALRVWHVVTENLMAVRQACQMAEISASEVEDLFYNNAMRLFFPKG